MPWQQRGARRYFYVARRVDGRPRRVYLGTGAVGEANALLEARRRRRRAAGQEAWTARLARLASADAILDELRFMAHLVAGATLVLAGLHEHRGSWRRRMGGSPGVEAAVAERPAESEGAETLAEAKSRLTALIPRASGGDAEALAELRHQLGAHPELWERLGDLALLVERAWIDLVAGGCPLMAESVRQQVARLKQDLAGPHPTATERLLVGEVVACWLSLKEAELGAAMRDGSLAQASLRVRRVEVAQRRFDGAMKLLGVLRAKLPAGLAPLNGVKLHASERKRA
jgi:hypothetical protein